MAIPRNTSKISGAAPAGLEVPTSPFAVLAIILVSYLMIVLDISIVITGLPKIRENLGLSVTELSWVQNAYTLCFGGFLLLGARAGDLLGRKRMFIIGLAVFTASSLAIGAATMPALLIGARAVQGLGAAVLAPAVLALISTNFPAGPERTRALAYYSMVAGVGSSLGLVLGGVFAELISWRVGFFVNVPIGIALMFAARRVLARSDRNTGTFDLVGAITSTIGMTALVYGIVRSADAGWDDPATLLTIAASVFFLAVFVVNEARVSQPILPLWLFASRERSGAYAARMLFLGAMLSFFFFTTQFMQGVLGFTPIQAGFGFLPMTIPTLAAAVLVQLFTRRLGNGGLLTLALALLAAGMIWLGRADSETSYLTGIALPMILIGFGNGFALGPLTVSGVAGVNNEHAGAASGLVNVAHQLGGSLGLAILVVVFAAAETGGLERRQLLAHQIATAITGGGVMLTLALVLVFVLIVRPWKAARVDPQVCERLA